MGIRASATSFHRLLQNCIHNKDLVTGRKIYSLIVKNGCESDTYLGSYLIRMFALCGDLLNANLVFNKLHKPNVYAWSEIILANTKYGHSEKALTLYSKMQNLCVKPDKHVFVAALKACASAGALTQGKQIHCQTVQSSYESDVFVRSTLIDMYAKCANLEDARNVFDKMLNQDIVVWNAMIAGYAYHAHCWEAAQLFQQMQQEGPKPNNRTWTAVLAGYAKHGFVYNAFQLFQQMLHEGLEMNNVTWNAIITGYALHAEGYEALWLFQYMIREGRKPDKITCLGVLKACAGIQDLSHGKLIHDHIIDSGLESDLAIGTSLMDMYAKWGNLEDAQNLFEKLPKRDVVAWNTMIAGFIQHGYGEDALKLFQQMQKEGMMPDNATLLSILKVCSNTSALSKGKLIHAHMIKTGLSVDECVGSTLIDMYAKCGSLKDACQVFKKLPVLDVVAWNAMIAGYALHNDHQFVLQYFADMQEKGLVPDDTTFVCLLSACSHMGLLDDASSYFNSMRRVHGIEPKVEHYNCMVDLLGRAGCLTEAEDLLCAMPFQPTMVPWTSLLSNCRIYGHVEIGSHCLEHIVAIDQRCAYGYALMSNICAASGLGDDTIDINRLRTQSNLWKKPGRAFIEIHSRVHGFIIGDNSHSDTNEIHAKLNGLNMQLRKQGHVSYLDPLPETGVDQDKVDGFGGHCNS